MSHLSPEPLQQRVLVEASAASRTPAQAHAISMPPPATPQPASDGRSAEVSVDSRPQHVQGGLSGPALAAQEAPTTPGGAEAADTRQEDAQGAGFKAHSKSRKAPLIAVDANTQEAAGDAAPPAQQPDAQKQCITPRTNSAVS